MVAPVLVGYWQTICPYSLITLAAVVIFEYSNQYLLTFLIDRDRGSFNKKDSLPKVL